MFCYAWGRFQKGPLIDVDVEDCPNVIDLFAKVLCVGIERLLRKGLDRSYKLHSEDLRTLRGKLDFDTFSKRGLRGQSFFPCHFDDLDHNVAHNQILRTTIRNLIPISTNLNGLKDDLRCLYRRLNGIDLIRIDKASFRSVQLNRNNATYLFLLQICQLIRQLLLPISGTTGKTSFQDILNNEDAMSLVFQDFIYNFYRQEQQDYSVKRDVIQWDLSKRSERIEYLPQMKTDMVLRSTTNTLVIDTKYYQEIFSKNQWGQKKFHSANLYQIYAYLKNLKINDFPYNKATGILIYPKKDEDIDVCYEIQGNQIRFVTLDLSVNWLKIEEQLKRIILVDAQ